MGRRPKEIDEGLLMDLVASGMHDNDICESLGITLPTLKSRIEKLKKSEQAILAYDKVHHLDLIATQQRLIAGVTDEKIGEAPLGQIAQALNVVTKCKQLATGRPTEITGLMGYLMVLEEEERKRKEPEGAAPNQTDEVIDV